MAFFVGYLHFPLCMLSLLTDVSLCAYASSSLAGAEIHVPFQPTCVHSLAAVGGLLWDQLL